MHLRGSDKAWRLQEKINPRQLIAFFRFFKSVISLGCCFVYIFYQFGGWTVLQYPLFFLALLLFFLSLPGAKTALRYFSLIMFAIGAFWYMQQGEGFDGAVKGLLVNVPLVSLMILIPLLSIPLKVGGYFRSIHFLLKKQLHNAKKLFTFITLFIFVLGPILNLGVLRVVHDMLEDLKIHPIIIIKGYITGYSPVIVWSPYFAAVAMVLYYLQLPVVDYLPYGLGMALTFFVLGNLLFRYQHSNADFIPPVSRGERKNASEKKETRGEEVHRKKVRNLFFLVGGLMVSVFAVEMITEWPMIFLVCLLAITFPAVWLTLRKRWKDAVPFFREYGEKSLPTFNNEAVLLLSAGWFSNALMNTAAAASIRDVLYGIASSSFFLFVLTIVFVMLLITLIGVHPFVVATVLLMQIRPEEIGVSPELIALIVMISWAVSSVAGPLNPVNLLVSSAAKEPPFNVGLRYNGPYLLLMLLTGILTVCGLHWWQTG